MNTSKEGIKMWLAKYPDRDRIWLADKCGVERKTVDNWLSSPREIPSKAILIIEDLMAADLQTMRPENVEDVVNMPVRVTPQQFDEYTRAFKLSKAETFREWLISALDSAAEEQTESIPMAAEAHDPGFIPAPMAGTTSYHKGKFKGPRAVPYLPQAETAK